MCIKYTERRAMIYLLRHGLDDEEYIGGWSDVGLTFEGKVKKINLFTHLNHRGSYHYNIQTVND